MCTCNNDRYGKLENKKQQQKNNNICTDVKHSKNISSEKILM